MLLSQVSDGIDLYYYPVMKADNSVIYTFRIYYASDELESVLSKDLVLGLNQIQPYTSKESPAHIYTEGTNVVAVIGENKFVLCTTDPSTEVISRSIDFNGIRGNNVVDITNLCSTNISSIFVAEKNAQLKASSNMLSTVIRETQGSTNWCSAYVTAFITSYKKGSATYAKSVMQWAYPNLSGSQLNNKSLGLTNTVNYAAKRGLYPAISYNAIPDSDVIYEINSNSPIYLSCKSSSGSHAIAIRGYTPYGYSVWNPWYNYYSLISRGSRAYVDATGKTWTWYRTIWRWR